MKIPIFRVIDGKRSTSPHLDMTAARDEAREQGLNPEQVKVEYLNIGHRVIKPK